MSLHIPKIALNILRIGEGGLRRREEECEGVCGRGEARPAAAPPVGASASAGAPLDLLEVLQSQADLQLSLGPYESCHTQRYAL